MKIHVWQASRRHWKSNNDGASLVTVLVLVSLIVIIVGLLLTMTLTNYFMKQQNVAAQQNFYDAESALEEVRQGLLGDLSDAAGLAYTRTLEQYESLSAEDRQNYFRKICYEELCQILQDGSAVDGKRYYDADHLAGFLTDTKQKTLSDGSVVGVSIETVCQDDEADGTRRENRLNQETDGIVLKNVKISYVDQKHNKTSISTDIALTYPQVDFSNAGSLENLVFYSVIAQKKYIQTGAGETKLSGNAYLGTEETKISNGSLTVDSGDASVLHVISGGNLFLTGADLSCRQTEIWAEGLTLSQGADWTMTSGNVYLQNDLVLNQDAGATLGGSLLAFGDPEVLADADSIAGDDLQKNPADYSSSIIINGKNARLDLTGLHSLFLAGVSYINTGQEASSVPSGQSVMTKGDQKAYLIPGELLGAGYENGGANPMTAQQWDKLCREIREAKGYEADTVISPSDLLSYDKTISGMGESLQSLGAADDYDRVAMQVNGLGTLYYFFMKFDRQEDRNAFVQKYYKRAVNYNSLQDNMTYYAGGQIALPDNVSDANYFYFQGNALASNRSSILLADSLTQQTGDTDAEQERKEKLIDAADHFAALKIRLSRDFSSLTDKQKKTGLFDNLVETDKLTSKAKKFVTEDGQGAVIVKGNYTISDKNDASSLSKVTDTAGNTHKDARVSLVIASGDVTVSRDFSGLIICGGTLTVESGCDLGRDIQAVTSLLQMQDQEGDGPGNYLKDTSRYLWSGGSSEATAEKSLSECIVYRNWKKVSE